jgi:hypothetical protein
VEWGLPWAGVEGWSGVEVWSGRQVASGRGRGNFCKDSRTRVGVAISIEMETRDAVGMERS